MTHNTINNVTMISTEELSKVAGGIFPIVGLPGFLLPDMVERIHMEEKMNLKTAELREAGKQQITKKQDYLFR